MRDSVASEAAQLRLRLIDCMSYIFNLAPSNRLQSFFLPRRDTLQYTRVGVPIAVRTHYRECL